MNTSRQPACKPGTPPWVVSPRVRLAADALALSSIVDVADNARDWQNLPIGLNMVFGYYNRIDTNTSIDTSLPLDGLRGPLLWA